MGHCLNKIGEGGTNKRYPHLTWLCSDDDDDDGREDDGREDDINTTVMRNGKDDKRHDTM